MAKKEIMKATFVGIVKVNDPDDGNEVELEIWKDPCGGIFAIDSSFLDQDTDKVSSPFNPTKYKLNLRDDGDVPFSEYRFYMRHSAPKWMLPAKK